MKRDEEVGSVPRNVRTMVFTPDFSLLFCLTHFTFINFSYPYDTNLFSYLPFLLSYTFTLNRSHIKKEQGSRLDSAGGSTKRRRQNYYHLMMKGGPFTSLGSSP